MTPPLLNAVKPTIHHRRLPTTVGRTSPPTIVRSSPMPASATSKLPVDPRKAAAGVQVGDPLIVDVDGHGSGWAIIAVYSDAYDLYRNGRDLFAVPHHLVHQVR
ncbi:hypothetical protein [Micromonospora sp. NPDC050695]|uniref:hypothetical protein n=1 Tax=Micromonospora sp. NPDC050695 TaxID=3154938 RepID=UPI0033CBE958